MENLILTVQNQGGDRRKKRITYLESFSKWMADQGLGYMAKRYKLLRAILVESHDRQRAEQTLHIEKVK